MKCAFVRCIHGGEFSEGSVSGGETAIHSDGESSIGEMESLYQLQDGRLGGSSDGSSILDPFEPPSRVGIFMAGTQPGQNSTAAAVMTSGSAAATTAGAGGPTRPPAHVLMALMDRMTALLSAVVNPADQAQHDAEVAQLREEVVQAKEYLAAEDVRMAAKRAALDARDQQIQSEPFQLMMDQNTSNEVMRRRHQKAQSLLPPVYDPRNLFRTPGAGPSNPPEVNRVATPGAGTLVQPRVTEPPHLNDAPPHYEPTPPGHYSNPLKNMITATERLAALPMDGDSPMAVKTRRVRELVQTALVQQEAYSYSRDRIHSTPHPSRSLSSSRHMDSTAVSSNTQHCDQPCGHDSTRDGDLNLIDQDRSHQEAERVVHQAAYQPLSVYPTTSIEAGVTTRTGGVPCLVPALRNERLPKDSTLR